MVVLWIAIIAFNPVLLSEQKTTSSCPLEVMLSKTNDM
jgi:hypothetical protein